MAWKDHPMAHAAVEADSAGETAGPNYPAILDAIQRDPRYRRNVQWGEPRPGHPEGAIHAHIADLDRNVDRLRSRLSEADAWKLRVLVHVHDTFKPEAADGAKITDPRSHASLARAFLAEFCDDAELLDMTQFHDEPYALWRQFRHGHHFNRARFDALLSTIRDWDLFLAFLIVDGSTEGKSREPLRWFLGEVAGRVPTSLTAADILA